jgi:Fic family protein
MSYRFYFTPHIVKYLQNIERVKETIHLTVLPPLVAEQLRYKAHIRSAHFSTRIEGNRLTLNETEEVIQQGRLFPGRERDVKEVERYYQALQQVEKWVEGRQAITESRIQKTHALLLSGRRAKPTPYRDGQNVIRDSAGQIVYLPPEAQDVPVLMGELVGWIHEAQEDYAAPVIAGIAHYQFVTIHPFFDGNGRSARLMATWILYQGGYDLGRFYALEEFYADDLESYYNALITHPHHNYYFGRHEADITPWLEYFLRGMAVVFERVADEVTLKAGRIEKDDDEQALLRPLDHRARRVLGLFAHQTSIQSKDVANLLGISTRQARDLLNAWVEQGWLTMLDPSRRGRKYDLADNYQKLL